VLASSFLPNLVLRVQHRTVRQKDEDDDSLLLPPPIFFLQPRSSLRLLNRDRRTGAIAPWLRLMTAIGPLNLTKISSPSFFVISDRPHSTDCLINVSSNRFCHCTTSCHWVSPPSIETSHQFNYASTPLIYWSTPRIHPISCPFRTTLSFD